MTERVHGYIIDDRLGSLMGDNAFVSIAVDAPAVEVRSTGVLTPLAQFKALYAYDKSKDIGEEFDQVVDVNNFSGDQVKVKLPNVPASLRTIGGKTYADDAEYTAAWAAQENLKRLVDIVQQRAVLIAMSKAGMVDASLVPAAGAVNGTNDRKYGQWNVSLTGAQLVTFLVERGTSFDKARPNAYGQPGGIVIGQELIEELSQISVLDGTGKSIKLDSTNFAVRIDRSVPQII